ncbi:hypothetical protein BsWGS_13236 [Bradybaena similaris]
MSSMLSCHVILLTDFILYWFCTLPTASTLLRSILLCACSHSRHLRHSSFSHLICHCLSLGSPPLWVLVDIYCVTLVLHSSTSKCVALLQDDMPETGSVLKFVICLLMFRQPLLEVVPETGNVLRSVHDMPTHAQIAAPGGYP